MAVAVAGAKMCMIAYLSTIVALSTGVAQGVIRNVRVLIQEHLELAGADAQVILIELIRNVPADGAILSALLQGQYAESDSRAQVS